MRALITIAVFLGGGAVCGAASRLTNAYSPGAPAKAGALLALVCVFGVAVCACAAFSPRDERLAARVRRGAVAWVAVFAAAWAAAAVAGAPSLVTAAFVPASAATLALGTSWFLRSRGVSVARSAFAGAAVPSALAALVFVADPLVEWHGGEGSLDRARTVVSVSPIASMAGAAGVDWQRMKWMYDGPAPGTGGLSVIGQSYPSRSTAPTPWALAAAAAGFAVLAAARPRSRIPA